MIRINANVKIWLEVQVKGVIEFLQHAINSAVSEL